MNVKEFATEQMQMVRGMLNEWVKEIPDEQMTVRAVDGGVHLAWILGHLAWSEAGVLNKFILQKPNPMKHLGKACRMGSTVVDDASAYPSKAEVLKLIEQVRSCTLKFLDGISEADLDTPVKDGPPEFKTWGSVLALIASHEGHHNGQISVIWRQLGHKPKV